MAVKPMLDPGFPVQGLHTLRMIFPGDHPRKTRRASATPGSLSRKLGDGELLAHTQVVAYDDAGGAYASRLWWMLNWLGHQGRRVDGGMANLEYAGPALDAITRFPVRRDAWR